MDDQEMKPEDESYTDQAPDLTQDPQIQDSTPEPVVIKKRKMEIELDYSLIMTEYKPRERRVVQRYIDTIPTTAIRNRSKYSDDEDVDREYKKKTTKHNAITFNCKDCHCCFRSNRSLTLHTQFKHKKSTKFTCALCSAIFTSNRDLIKHKIVHRDEEKNFLCMKCEMAFTDHYEYLKHMVLHDKSSTYYCIECGTECDTKPGYITHIRQHHTTIIKCETCNADIVSTNMANHMKLHTIAKEICVECGKEYKKNHMTYHMISHTGVKPFQCLYCGKGFSNKTQREIHTRIHTGDKPMSCKLCNKRYRQYSDLKRHMETHTQKVYECEICKRSFKHKESLQNHLDTHNNTERYVCKICGYKTHTHTGLKSHALRAHLEEKNYKCEPCGVAFKIAVDLTKHCRFKRHKNNVYRFMNKGK